MLLYCMDLNCGETETDLSLVKFEGNFLKKIALKSEHFTTKRYVNEPHRNILVSDNCV